MKLTQLLAGIGILAAGLTTSSLPAHAFNFATNLPAGSVDSKGDLMLQSVTIDGKTVTDFALVHSVNIVQNDQWTGGNRGAASSDKGDNATGIKAEDPTGANLATSLGNRNLNNIVDGEDSGSFKLNLSFDKAVANLLFWERGMNSKLGVQGLDAAGNLIGNLLVLDSSKWQQAGFQIDTQEIDGAQNVGSLGVSLADLGLAGPIAAVQLTANGSYNGPDFKVMGEAAAVPEPATMAGLALAGSGLAMIRRRQLKKA